MRILFLASKLSEPSCRFRFLQFIPYLQERGIIVDVVDLAVSPTERWRVFQRAAQYDVVLIHRVLLRLVDHWFLRFYVRDYIFDFDDALFFRDSSQKKGFYSRQRLLRFQRMVQGAGRVIAGNHYLYQHAVPYNPETVVLPTTVDLRVYARLDEENCREPIIGWIGTRSNLVYLQSIAGALSCVGQGRWKPKLKIVSDAFLDIPGIEVIKKPWTLEEEAEDVSSFQIGIMPLLDDPWTRGKCALKILQYMAASRPVVCSPVGANCDVVEAGTNGYFAGTEAEWILHLERLLSDSEERIRCGSEGRAHVERSYSTQGNVDRLLKALTQA